MSEDDHIIQRADSTKTDILETWYLDERERRSRMERRVNMARRMFWNEVIKRLLIGFGVLAALALSILLAWVLQGVFFHD